MLDEHTMIERLSEENWKFQLQIDRKSTQFFCWTYLTVKSEIFWRPLIQVKTVLVGFNGSAKPNGEYLGKLSTGYKNILRCEPVSIEEMFDENKTVRKSRETVLFSIILDHTIYGFLYCLFFDCVVKQYFRMFDQECLIYKIFDGMILG